MSLFSAWPNPAHSGPGWLVNPMECNTREPQTSDGVFIVAAIRRGRLLPHTLAGSQEVKVPAEGGICDDASRVDLGETPFRYAAYASRLNVLLPQLRIAAAASVRYVAYSSDVGESLRPVLKPWQVADAVEPCHSCSAVSTASLHPLGHATLLNHPSGKRVVCKFLERRPILAQLVPTPAEIAEFWPTQQP